MTVCHTHPRNKIIDYDTFKNCFVNLGTRKHLATIPISGNYRAIELYEAWDKLEKAEGWRAKLPQTKAVEQ